MVDGPSIPWTLAEEIYKVYEFCFRGQSLECIAERGGFGYSELPHFMRQWHKRKALDHQSPDTGH